MSGSYIPDDIAHFIAEKIDSIAQLEALLLLRDNPERQWSVRALAARLYVDEEQTARLLTEIASRALSW